VAVALRVVRAGTSFPQEEFQEPLGIARLLRLRLVLGGRNCPLEQYGHDYDEKHDPADEENVLYRGLGVSGAHERVKAGG